MTETKYSTGKTTIAPEVLVSIARLTALGIEGVSRLAILPVDVGPIFRNPEREGVRIEVIGNLVNVDVYVVIQRDFNVRDVARACCPWAWCTTCPSCWSSTPRRCPR